MTPQQVKHSLISIILLALLCWSIWLYEIVAHVGWRGLEWLNQELLSPYWICLLIATAYIQPFWIRYRHIDGKLILTTLTLFLLNTTAYILGSDTLRLIFNKKMSFLYSFQYKIGLSFLTILLFGLGYFFVTDKLIFNIKRKYAVLFLTYPLLGFVLSLGTNFFIRGYATTWGMVDMVKMGFPQFWLCLIMGLIGIIVSSTYIEENTEGVPITNNY